MGAYGGTPPSRIHFMDQAVVVEVVVGGVSSRHFLLHIFTSNCNYKKNRKKNPQSAPFLRTPPLPLASLVIGFMLTNFSSSCKAACPTRLLFLMMWVFTFLHMKKRRKNVAMLCVFLQHVIHHLITTACRSSTNPITDQDKRWGESDEE